MFLYVSAEFCLTALNTTLKCFVALETRREVLSVGKASLRAGKQAGARLPHCHTAPEWQLMGKFSSFLVTGTHFHLEGLWHRLPATSPSLTILTCWSEQAGHKAATHTHSDCLSSSRPHGPLWAHVFQPKMILILVQQFSK